MRRPGRSLSYSPERVICESRRRRHVALSNVVVLKEDQTILQCKHFLCPDSEIRILTPKRASIQAHQPDRRGRVRGSRSGEPTCGHEVGGSTSNPMWSSYVMRSSSRVGRIHRFAALYMGMCDVTTRRASSPTSPHVSEIQVSQLRKACDVNGRQSQEQGSRSKGPC